MIMKKSLHHLLSFSALALGTLTFIPAPSAVAADTPAASADKSYPATEAKNHVGESAFITGKVDGVRVTSSGMTLVNLDGRYPDQAFTIVVRPEHAKDVGDLSPLDGKTVTVHGKITDFKGKPQIEITKREAITEKKK